MKRKFNVSIALCLSFVTVFNYSSAQDESLIEKLKNDFSKEYLTIGALFQVVSDFHQIDRGVWPYSGFSISNLRWRIYGKLDKNISYFLQANFVQSPAMLDGYLIYRFLSTAQLTAGLFKAPFSKEFLIDAQDIDFVNRSQVVSNLAPGRQIGLQLSGWLGDEIDSLYYAIGAFNGNNYLVNRNDNQEFLYSARLAFHHKFSCAQNAKDQLEIGINAATSTDRRASVTWIYPNYRGKRHLFGGDFRWTMNNLLFSGEYIFSSLESSYYQNLKPQGFHLTTGYMMSFKSQILLRFDRFKLDKAIEPLEYLIIGYNLWHSSVAQFQANYIINLDQSDFKYHQLLLNFQINFN